MARMKHSSVSDEWYTPSGLIEQVYKVFEMGIHLDPASCMEANKIVNAYEFYDKDMNGLVYPWGASTIWLNPPYSQAKTFIRKLLSERKLKNFNHAMVLMRNATETEWFQDMLYANCLVCFPDSRIRFLRPDGEVGGSPLYGNALFLLSDCEKMRRLFIRVFQYEYGAVLGLALDK